MLCLRAIPFQTVASSSGPTGNVERVSESVKIVKSGVNRKMGSLRGFRRSRTLVNLEPWGGEEERFPPGKLGAVGRTALNFFPARDDNGRKCDRRALARMVRMEPNDPVLSGGDSPSPLPVPGELVVHHGRPAGTRRPLASPATVIGRAAGCDLRLNVEGVHPLHCAIFTSPAGLVLRDLGSDSGTLVNDQRVTTCLLRDGDLLGIGPFQF